MQLINFKDGACRRVQAHFDAYMDNELLVETNRDVLEHLESCPRCATTLDDQIRFRAALRRAGSQVAVPEAVGDAVRSSLNQASTARAWPRWAAVAAAAAVVLTLGLTSARLFRQPAVPAASTPPPALLVDELQVALSPGVDNHVYCTIEHGFDERSFTRAEMETAIGASYTQLVSLVEADAPPEYTLTVAHHCTTDGRRFIHLVLQGNESAVSLAVTAKGGTAFPRRALAEVLDEFEFPLYADQVRGYEVAGFESRNHYTFVVSDLTRSENVRIATALASSVREFLSQIEI